MRSEADWPKAVIRACKMLFTVPDLINSCTTSKDHSPNGREPLNPKKVELIRGTVGFWIFILEYCSVVWFYFDKHFLPLQRWLRNFARNERSLLSQNDQRFTTRSLSTVPSFVIRNLKNPSQHPPFDDPAIPNFFQTGDLAVE